MVCPFGGSFPSNFFELKWQGLMLFLGTSRDVRWSHSVVCCGHHGDFLGIPLPSFFASTTLSWSKSRLPTLLWRSVGNVLGFVSFGLMRIVLSHVWQLDGGIRRAQTEDRCALPLPWWRGQLQLEVCVSFRLSARRASLCCCQEGERPLTWDQTLGASHCS